MRGPPPKLLAAFTLADVIGVAVAAGLTVLLVVGLLGPLSTRGREAAADLQNAVRQKQRANSTAAAVRTLSEDVARTRGRIAASPLHLRPQNALNQELAALVALSNACGLSVDDIKPGMAARGVRFVAVPVAVSGHGSYRSSADFLHRLHERMPEIGVRGFQLAGNPEQAAADGHYAFDLQWLALPDAPNTAVAALPPQ